MPSRHSALQPPPVMALRQRHHFDDWLRATRDRERIFVWRHRVDSSTLPECRLMRNRVAPLGALERLNTSIWTPPGPDTAVPVVLDVYELPTLPAAHEALIALAGQFHQPVAMDMQADDVGELRLATHGGTWFAFVRGNLLLRLSATTVPGVPIRTLAHRLDEALMARPAQLQHRASAAARAVQRSAGPHFEADSAAPGAVRIVLPGATPTPRTGPAPAARAAIATSPPVFGEEAMVKVYSQGGIVHNDGGLLFVPDSAGAPVTQLDVFVVSPDGRVVSGHQAGPP